MAFTGLSRCSYHGIFVLLKAGVWFPLTLCEGMGCSNGKLSCCVRSTQPVPVDLVYKRAGGQV